MMQFYMTPGSCSTGIHILLEELELVFSANIVNLLAGDQFKPEFVAINPRSTIPVLVRDDGSALCDFTAIAWWLATRYPKAGLLPEQQAEALEVINFAVNHLHGDGFTRIFTPDRHALREEDHAAIEAKGREIVSKGFEIIAARLHPDSGYVFENFSIADAALFYVEFWAVRVDLPLPAACQKHYETMLSRPVVKQVLMEEGYRV